MKIRRADFAGSWYPDQEEQMRRYLQSGQVAIEKKAIGALVPHAGWKYSGDIASSVWQRLPKMESLILIGPNHRCVGNAAALSPDDAWQTPFGTIPIDASMKEALQKNAPFLKEDAEAHAHEHSLEIQIPFIQMLWPDASILPILLYDYRLTTCQALAEALARGVRNSKRRVMLAASSDLNHYESQEISERKDRIVISCMEKLDEDDLLKKVQKEEISMCGAGPAAVVISAARKLGASRGNLVRYGTSAEATGGRANVVGYAGMIFV